MLPLDPLVLVVDDDATVRKVLAVALERAGFRVLAAEHGLRALEVIAEAGEPVKVMLTDVVMPEMGGVALAEKVLAGPNPPVIMLMSGFAHDPSKLKVSGRSLPFLQKPFNMDDVVKRVRAAAEPAP